MGDGVLYCQHCGHEIHIVPDFEPELEQNIQQVIKGIREDIEEDLPDKEGKEPEKKRRRFLIPALIAALVLSASLGMGVWAWLHNSLSYQVNRAGQCAAQEKYDKAIRYYKRALELDSGNTDLLFCLAEMYYRKNNKVEYEYLLREIVKQKDATVEQLDGAYSRLIAIYRDRGDYETINQLLLSSGNKQLISLYQAYIAEPPEFSVVEGYYTNIQALKLSASGNGRIYYTLDGTDPDETSGQYTMPIILEDGDHVVKAVFINEKGIVSDIVTKEYHIENDRIPAPEVSVVSGDYTRPLDIEVLGLEEGEEVYYTTDGSTPTYASSVYTRPIHMPLGESHYKFARVVEGVTGDVTERVYNLELQAGYTPAQAVDIAEAYALESGRVFDEAGHFGDTGAMYIYEFLYAATLSDDSDYYVIAEVQREADNVTQVRTGNFYAVNVYGGTLYQLQPDGAGRLRNLVVTGAQEEAAEGAANTG